MIAKISIAALILAVAWIFHDSVKSAKVAAGMFMIALAFIAYNLH